MTPSRRSGKAIRLKVRNKNVRKTAPVPESSPAAPTVFESVAFQALMRAMYDAMVIVDPAGRILQVSPRAEEMLAMPAGALVGTDVSSLLAGLNASMLKSLISVLSRRRFALVQVWCGRDRNRNRFAAEAAISLLQRDPDVLCLFIRDVTQRKQAEIILQTGYNAMQNAASGIIILDLRGQVEYANPAAQALWGTTTENSLLGRSFSHLVRDEGAAENLLASAGKQERIWSGEMPAKRLDGTGFLAQITAACNRNVHRKPIGTVVSVQDVTEARDAEEKVRQAERQGAMLASLGAACHHLAQPATVLIGNLGILEHLSETLPPEARELIHSAQEAADRLTSILHRLNEVNEYRTTPYLGSDSRAPENRLLQI